MLNVNHHLYQLSESLNWVGLEKEIVSILGSGYRPVVRLVCGTVYLKSLFNLSTAEVIEKWASCPNFRYFCGEASATKGTINFPIPQHSLDMLTCQLNNEAHEVMIQVLMETSIGYCESEPKVVH